MRWRASKVRFLIDSCRFIFARASSTPSAHLFSKTCITCDSSYRASAMACDATLSSLKYSAWIRLCLSLSRAVATLFSTARSRVPRIMAILAVKASCDLRAINEGGGTFGASCRAKNVLTHTKAASLRCEAAPRILTRSAAFRISVSLPIRFRWRKEWSLALLQCLCMRRTLNPSLRAKALTHLREERCVLSSFAHRWA